MTNHAGERPTTDDEFEAALSDLVNAAHENGIDVRGGWLCENHDGITWDVVVTRLTSERDD